MFLEAIHLNVHCSLDKVVIQYLFKWTRDWIFLDLVFQGRNTFNQIILILFHCRKGRFTIPPIQHDQNFWWNQSPLSLFYKPFSNETWVKAGTSSQEHLVLARKTQNLVTVSLWSHWSKGFKPGYSAFHLDNHQRLEFWALKVTKKIQSCPRQL